MKVTNEKTENSQAYLTIEMEPAEMEESLESSYRRLVKRVNVPGFRKGKAPRAVLERHVGQESLLNEALDEMLPRAYEKALKEQEIDAIAQPEIEVVQTDPVIFKAIVPLRPVVRLGDYHSIKDTPEPVKVTEDDVKAVIEELRHQHAVWEPVQRPVDFGDLVVLDVDSDIEGEPFVNRKGAQYQVMSGSPAPAPGFAEQLKGMSQNDEKEFKLKFPSDYSRNEFADKEASFKVKVTEIKQENLPKVTNKFAEQVDPEFKTLKSLRQRISDDLTRNREERNQRDFEQRVLEAVVDLSELEFPPILVDNEIHRLIEDQSRRFQMQGGNMDEYLRTVNKTEEELHEELHPVAEKRVSQSLVLGKITEEEKIEVNDSDIDAEIEAMIISTVENKEQLKKALNTPQTRQSIEQTLLVRKTVQRLGEIAQGLKETKQIQKQEDEK
jgi:trigger factor